MDPHDAYAGMWLMIMAETCICNSHHVVYRLIDSTYFRHLSCDDWSVCTTRLHNAYLPNLRSWEAM